MKGLVQKLYSLILVSTLAQGPVALASSYQKTDGTIIDPILDASFSTHPYNGPNLEPELWLDCCMDLSGANLADADLTGADSAGLFEATLAAAPKHLANVTCYWDDQKSIWGLTENLTFYVWF